LRKRNPGDLLETLRDNKEVCVVVQKRDEWNEDLHLVAPSNFAFHVLRTDSGHCKQFEFDVGPVDPIRVIYQKVSFHPWQQFPIKVFFNRFVLGRPNPIRLSVVPTDHFSAADHQSGADLNLVIGQMDLWTYTDVYPPFLHIDCSNLSVKDPIRIGDVEKMLPDGVFLHKKYLHRKNHSVIKLEETGTYKARVAIREKKQKDFEEKKKEIEMQDAMRKPRTFTKKKQRKKFEKKA
jgi:hypothetical protein